MRNKKLTCRDAEDIAEEENVTCATCPNVKLEMSKYCRSCKMYWEDVHNGLFDEPLHIMEE